MADAIPGTDASACDPSAVVAEAQSSDCRQPGDNKRAMACRTIDRCPSAKPRITMLPVPGGHDGSGAGKTPQRTVSFTTGLPWHISSRKRDRQLLNAAKKGLLYSGVHRPAEHAGHEHDRASQEGGDQRRHDWHSDEGPHHELHAGFMHFHLPGFAGAEASVDEALKRGADINAADYNGNTALHYACEEGYLELVQYLLSFEDVSIDEQGPRRSGPCSGREGVQYQFDGARW
jgi:hypothetical protein